MRELDPQRPGFVRGLVEGRGQAGADSVQFRAHQHAGAAPADADVRFPGRAAGQVIQHRPAFGLTPAGARRRHTDCPGRLEMHAAIGLGARNQAHRLTQRLCAHLGNGQRLLGEAHPSARSVERRHAVHQPQPIAAEAVLPLHRRVGHLAQRHHQAQVQCATAFGAHAVGEVVDMPGHRALGDEAQEIRRGTARLAVDGHDLARQRIEVGHVGDHVEQLDVEHARSRRLDAHARPFEAHFAMDAVDHRPARRVVEQPIGHLHRHEELALAVTEREIVQPALQAQPRIGNRGAADGGTHPLLRVVIDHARQVAPHGSAFRPRQARLHVDLARSTRLRPVAARRGAGCIGVFERRRIERDFEAPAMALPAALGA